MASPQAERPAPLRTMRTDEIDAIVAAVRRAETVPALQRHFEKQGPLLGARTPEAYVRLFREHVRRQDLRVFTYIRPEDAAARMRGVEAHWVEAIPAPEGWRFEENWTWPF